MVNDEQPLTCRRLYEQLNVQLQKAGCDDPAFEAVCLLEDFVGVPHGQLPAWYARPVSPQAAAAARAAADRRTAGEPLQYILGRWAFLSLTLEVGEGVLIPRPDTELLCEVGAAMLPAGGSALDLCAGSGCVALGLCSLTDGARVTAVELMPAALHFLRHNVAAYPQYAVTVCEGDVLAPPMGGEPVDLILSNPPYIRTDELAGLQKEVRREPESALCGGADGLRFYRAIAAGWLPRLRRGGGCAVEVGIGQAAEVEAILAAGGLRELRRHRDAGGIERVVSGRVG